MCLDGRPAGKEWCSDSLGRRSHAVVKQNLAFALSFIVLLLIANFIGIPMALGFNWARISYGARDVSGLGLLRIEGNSGIKEEVDLLTVAIALPRLLLNLIACSYSSSCLLGALY